MELNGWQRAWIVFTAAWLLGAAILFVSKWQSEAEMYHNWAGDLLAYLVEQEPTLRGPFPESLRSSYADLSDKDFVQALHKDYVPKHPAYSYGFAEIDSRYSLSSLLSQNQASGMLVRWLMVAIGVPLLVYLAGLSIAWVRGGFKHGKRSIERM